MAVQHLISFLADGDVITMMIWIDRSRPSSGPLCDESPPAHQVVCGSAEAELPINEPATTVPQLAEESDRLQPAKGLLNQLPLAMTQSIAGMTRRPRVDGATGVREFVLRNMRRDV